ncbi:MAG TPA: 3-phosphoshikimate 1-carboxyvinyltransferase, partial [Longimicrobiaceae bacterium]|nr:3-phosphoshikimate 1-carboxyvinyltransferase [Longimicrobiaceae bacterium]
TPETVLDCGNSGTTTRLLMGLLAGRPFCAALTGDASLRSRPMRRVTEPLQRMGAGVRELERPDRLPVELCGATLVGIHHRSPKASAQIKSAVLLAGLSGGVAVSVHEPGQSRDHTERMLAALGARVSAGRAADGGWEVGFEPPTGPLRPLEMAVPGDPSSAAFLAALALLADEGELTITGVDLNPTRTGFFRVVERMGARIEVVDERDSGGEPVGDLVVHAGRLRSTTVGGDEVPSMIDELPVLATLAARAEGETVVRGAEELRAKESDRIVAIVSNLREIGVEAEELPDGFVVHGTDRPLRGRVRTYHDHRIAMAFGVLAALQENDLAIEAPEVVDVSFPGFWHLLARLTSNA